MDIPSSYEELQQMVQTHPGSYTKRFATYSLGPVDVAQGADEQDSFTVDTNSLFVWVKTCYSADIAGATQTRNSRVVPLINVQLQDTGSERSMFKTPVRIDDIAGYGEIPFILPVPYLFAPNSDLNATLSNFSAATAYDNVQIDFIGYRVYQMGPAPGNA